MLRSAQRCTRHPSHAPESLAATAASPAPGPARPRRMTEIGRHGRTRQGGQAATADFGSVRSRPSKDDRRPPLGCLRRLGGDPRRRATRPTTLSSRTPSCRRSRNSGCASEPHRLGPAAPCRRATGRGSRRHAALPEVPQPGRIHLRPRLGRRLRAGRRQLLSEAAGRRAVHAGDRAPRLLVAAGRRRRRGARRPAGRGADARPSATAPRRSTSTSRTEERVGGMGEQGLAAARGPAIPLGEPRLRDLRRLPGRALLGPAQDHPARAARRAGRWHRSSALTGADDHRRALGRLLRLLHGHRLAQVGPALSQPPRSSPCWASGWPTGCC